MYLEDCEALAIEHPALVTAIARLDELIVTLTKHDLVTTDSLAWRLNCNEAEVQQVIRLLSLRGLLQESECVRCRCGTLIPQEYWQSAADAGEEQYCSCGRVVRLRSSTELVTCWGVTSQLRTKVDLMNIATARRVAPSPAKEELPQVSAAGVALLLSGGGYRAAAFHLGVLRWMYENGSSEVRPFLRDIKSLVAVSGGALTGVHFSKNRDRYCSDFFSASEPLMTLLTTDHLTEARIQGTTPPGSLFTSLVTASDTMEAINADIDIAITATSLRTGSMLVFKRQSVDEYSHDATGMKMTHHIASSPRISFVLAATSAFPPVFPPIEISNAMFQSKLDPKLLGHLNGDFLADGGIRDNIGIEYYSTIPPQPVTVVSDAGRPFGWIVEGVSGSSAQDWYRRSLRVADILSQRVAELQRERLMESIVVSVDQCAASARTAKIAIDHNAQFYAQHLPESVLSRVPVIATDMSPLTPYEMYALVRGGYDEAGRQMASLNHVPRTGLPDVDFWQRLFAKCENVSQLDGDSPTSFQSLLDSEARRRSVAELFCLLPFKETVREVIKYVGWPRSLTWVLAVFAIAIIAIGISALWVLFKTALLADQHSRVDAIAARIALCEEQKLSNFGVKLSKTHLEALQKFNLGHYGENGSSIEVFIDRLNAGQFGARSVQVVDEKDKMEVHPTKVLHSRKEEGRWKQIDVFP